jgi:hypothetical protein
VFLQLTPVFPVQLVVPAGTILHLGLMINLESVTTAAAAMVKKTTMAIVRFILNKGGNYSYFKFIVK